MIVLLDYKESSNSRCSNVSTVQLYSLKSFFSSLFVVCQKLRKEH